MSNILTNNINPRSGNLITIGGTNDRVSIAGTLSYEDVTNIDSVGIITAQSGIRVTGGSVAIGVPNPGHQLTVKGAGSNTAIANFFGGTVGRGLVIATDNDGGVGDDTVIYNATQNSGSHVFQVDASEKMRIDSTGNLGIGTDNPSRTLTVVSPSGSANILGVFDNSGGSASNCVIAFSDPTSTQGQFSTRIGCVADGLAFYTSGANRRMSITDGGSVLVGRTSNVTGGSGGNFAFVAQCFTNEENRPIAAFRRNTYNSVQIFGSNGGDGNSANCIMRVRGHSSGNRSINAGGSVNATGADYAEYMTKDGEFIIAKGDICGVTFDGKLTNNFVDAISFVVKSTDPSYIGNDVWGIDVENEEQREVARQMVDRIAFAGQVPVNVTGATPGQYIVPIQDDGGISGIAKDETDLTLIEYMRAVGKVIAIEDDGRARIIVKVA